MAVFCLATRMSPSEYLSLTREQYVAFCKALEAQG